MFCLWSIMTCMDRCLIWAHAIGGGGGGRSTIGIGGWVLRCGRSV